MHHSALRLAALALLTAPAFGESEELFRFARPDGTWGDWGHSFAELGDLDADGVVDFVVGVQAHGGGPVATVHSGADGAYLFTLNVPAAPLFWGMGFAPLPDETGDGVAEIVAIGAHSGAPNSPNGVLTVFSGSDGSIVRRMVEHGALLYVAHGQSNRAWMPDVDGDGGVEVFCRTNTFGVGMGYSLVSTATGDAVYTVIPTAPRVLMEPPPVRLADRDGDGIDDFALAVRSSTQRFVEFRSGADGSLIDDEAFDGLDDLFGGNVPFMEIADCDGDGVRDFAAGAGFDGHVGLDSGVDGSFIREWDCATQPDACFGSRLVELPDFSGDGHPDLLALETGVFGNGGMRVFGLDPLTGAVLFDDHLAGMAGGYSLADRIIALTGDGDGVEARFLMFEEVSGEVVARRVIPEFGARFCASTPHSAGEAATLRALGSASLAAHDLALVVDHALPSHPVVFVYGSASGATPFGNGTLCAAGSIERVQAVFTDASGRAEHAFDLALLETEPGSTWTFQAVFRDPPGGGAQTSDALAIEWLP